MSNECPRCGAEFDSSRGLRVHHSQAHGEYLANRVCETCGTDFYCEHERKYCSEVCRDEGSSFGGSSNPNYRGAKETTICERCGGEFEYYPSTKAGKYCGKCVEEGSWRDPPVLTGSDHPRWKGGRIQAECGVCGATLRRYPSEIGDGVVVCSERCRREWLSAAFEGAGHPNWKGGGNEAYGKGWKEVREKALERDGYECVVCSKPKAEIGRNPDVHHIVPVRAFIEAEDRTKEDAHTIDNVVSLCVSCHRKADFGNISPGRLRSLLPRD